MLVRKGTPAVIAMQYEITDAAAVELSRAFYVAIRAGLPVDAALTEARKAVALWLPGTVEWGTPVLHLRAQDGRIFDLGHDTPATARRDPDRRRRRRRRQGVSPPTRARRGRRGVDHASSSPGSRSPRTAATSRVAPACSCSTFARARSPPIASCCRGTGSRWWTRGPSARSTPTSASSSSRSGALDPRALVGSAGFDLDVFDGASTSTRTHRPVRSSPESTRRRRAGRSESSSSARRRHVDVVVGGADDTGGRVELDITVAEIDTPVDGEAYIAPRARRPGGDGPAHAPRPQPARRVGHDQPAVRGAGELGRVS